MRALVRMEDALVEIIWVSGVGGAVPYDAATHRVNAWNFLFWNIGDGFLLVGDGQYDGKECRDASHCSLAACAQEHGVRVPAAPPDGAGNCVHGRITGWSSGGFDIKTPEDLRKPIASALGMQ